MYISSIVCRYGDETKVRADVATLNEILGRQGVSLLLDVVAESIGTAATKYKFSAEEIKRVTDRTVTEFRDAIQDRT